MRNESYFRGTPHIEKINWLILSGADVIPAGLEDGSIDITANTPAADLERFIDNPEFQMYWQPTAVYCSLAVNFNLPFLCQKCWKALPTRSTVKPSCKSWA